MNKVKVVVRLWQCEYMKKIVTLPRSDQWVPQNSAIFCGQKWLKSTTTSIIWILKTPFMGKVPFINLLGHELDHLNTFLPKLFVILLKSSTICRIFRDPGSPRSCLIMQSFEWPPPTLSSSVIIWHTKTISSIDQKSSFQLCM